MDVTLQYFDGCPHWRLAESRLTEALRSAGLEETSINYQKIESSEEAERLSFRGSPTILVDGRDPFAGETQPVGMTCRLYDTEDGREGAPSVAQMQDALGG